MGCFSLSIKYMTKERLNMLISFFLELRALGRCGDWTIVGPGMSITTLDSKAS